MFHYRLFRCHPWLSMSSLPRFQLICPLCFPLQNLLPWPLRAWSGRRWFRAPRSRECQRRIDACCVRLSFAAPLAITRLSRHGWSYLSLSISSQWRSLVTHLTELRDGGLFIRVYHKMRDLLAALSELVVQNLASSLYSLATSLPAKCSIPRRWWRRWA